MKKHFKSALFAVLLLVGATLTPLALSTPASAVNVYKGCSGVGESAICDNKGEDLDPMLDTVVNTLMFVIGTIAVIMIIIGGIKFTTSNGDASGIKSAKDTILYSIVGLVVAMLAWAIVRFVINQF